ncbi:MAG: glycoside hydrolase family 2 [Tannerella sp.]|jgi:hypothetical protein|nr:glycoside hydrolase family 2 [Tannerella sp.]
MKYFLFNNALILMALSLIMAGCGKNNSDLNVALESGFDTPPDSVRTGCYWYWIDKTITKEGVIADLQAMKKAGVTRAYVGLTGGGDELPFMGDEWWELIHTTLKTAGELDIEIGMFNCPGWSQSGGPWIKNTQSMRYLEAIRREVKGPAKFSAKIPVTQNDLQQLKGLIDDNSNYQVTPADFRDFKVLAFPVNKGAEPDLLKSSEYAARTTASANIKSTSAGYKLPEKEEATITFTLGKAAPAQSLVISLDGKVATRVDFQAKTGDGFTSIKQFTIDRTDNLYSRGFRPYAPVAITFPETTAAEYRLVFSNTGRDGLLTGFRLTHAPVVERYPEKTFAKMFNDLAPPWDAFMWPEETADPTYSIKASDVLDISDKLAADGTLTWDVPEGEWVIMRTGMVPTGIQNSPSPKGGSGLEVDKMSSEHTAYHHDQYIGAIVKRIPAEDRKTFRVNVMDSYEKGGQNITDHFIEIFKERYGYDPTPFFPAYYGYPVGSPELSDRFLWDMRRLVADRIAHEYVRTLREKSHEDGIMTWLENYGSWGFAGEFLQYGGQSDEVGGEFWVGYMKGIGEPENRCATSCAHTYGKHRVYAEAFTGGGDHYTFYPGNIKQRGDWAVSTGINTLNLHVNIQQQDDSTYPGTDAWYNIQFNRKNTWYQQLDLFTTYVRRCGFLLQQGLDVADVAYFIGESAPKMSGIEEPKCPAGYHYDHINAEVLAKATVKNGLLTLPHGTQYRVLVLPPEDAMRPETLANIIRLADEGATIVANTIPVRSPSMQNYPDCDREVKELATKLEPKVLQNTTLEEVFAKMNLAPDFRVSEQDSVLYTHRRVGDIDIYFVTNQANNRPIQVTPVFRVAGRQPEFWDPVLAERRDLPAFSQNGETTAVPLQLEANGSGFIIFRKAHRGGTIPADGYAANFPAAEIVAEITSPWEVRFESDCVKRGPAEPVVFTELADWSANENPQIRDYSGTAVYKTIFNFNSQQPTANSYLDLGKVGVMAKVRINGQYAGGVWTPPYRVNITDFVKDGDNEIEVEVVNLWVNRLLADAKLPESERALTISNLPWTKENESGLLGPVKIIKQ